MPLMMRVGACQIPSAHHAREGGPDRGIEDRTGQAHEEDEDVDGGEIRGEDQPQDENRPRKVAGHQDDPAVDAIRDDSGQRARNGGQQTGDERTAHGRGAARDLYHQDHERDHGDRVAHERGPLADPEPQKARVPKKRVVGGVHPPPRQRDPSPGSGRMYSWRREPPSSLTDGAATRLWSGPWKAFHVRASGYSFRDRDMPRIGTSCGRLSATPVM